MNSRLIFKLALLLSLAFFDLALARDLPNLDRTDKVSDRRYLDSLNVYNRRPIRVNQSGFRPQDPKYAYVSNPTVSKFTVIDANSGKEAWSGNLTEISRNVPIYGKDSVITGFKPAPITRPGITVRGAFNNLLDLYNFQDGNSETDTETLFRADFTGLSPSTPGEYFIVVGKDTSATFHIHPSVYNSILEMALQFFGIQRCGDTKSHFHGKCHMKDGSAVGHDLTGGWHDCGDHFKVSETVGYSSYVLSTVYLTYPDKAEDVYGNSYADTTFTDGIPDILYEAKIGTDFLLKLYRASKADGLIAQNDMYHSVGVSDPDHAYWDMPERQDAQPREKGGPDRPVLTGIGSNTSGMMVAAMANVAYAYRIYDADYSDSLLEAAKDIYQNIVMYTFEYYKTGGRPGRNTDIPAYYTGGGPLYDDGAAAALALWNATKDTIYQYDLYKNKDIFDNSINYENNLNVFKAGFLGNPDGFNAGGWASDYQNIHAYVLFNMQKMILEDETRSLELGLSPEERDTLSTRLMSTFRKYIDTSTGQGDSTVLTYTPVVQGTRHDDGGALRVIRPYNLVWTTFDWGVIRYNLGTANAIFMMYELTGDDRYLKVALDNIYYALGANPWDMSFLMGAGDKNLNHPHNRAANPDGLNTGGLPYKYRCPIGAIMGGRAPDHDLLEDYETYTTTETCIDFTSQLLFPTQSLAETLPVDVEGPLFSNIAGTPITDTSAVISWDANEVALVTVFYNTTPDQAGAKEVAQTKGSKGGSITLNGLVPGVTYYFFLEGMDTKRNLTTDDNHGQWYQFTMTSAQTNISGITICQVDHRSAKIYWWTSDRMNGIVNYGTAKDALNQTLALGGGAVLFHEAELKDLLPGTTYYFTVSSGLSTSPEVYSFTTEEFSSTVEMEIDIKPVSKNGCANSSNWKDCTTFLVIVTNRDTMNYEDLDLRIYVPVNTRAWSYNNSQWDGSGGSLGSLSMKFDSPEAYTVTSASGNLEQGYYIPIHIDGTLYVSGSYFFELEFEKNFGELDGAWSFRPHMEETDPEKSKGIDLTRGPLYKETSNSTMYIETINGVREVAFTKTPYITAYYHGKYVYGYAPDYTPEKGPQVQRKVELKFSSPFQSPYYSLETTEYDLSFMGTSSVSPMGYLDDLEMNGQSQMFMYDKANKFDSFVFGKDTTFAYGNNYTEWVSWHNHGANSKEENKYDCACAVVRSNVEVDTITTPLEVRFLNFDKEVYSAYTGKRTEVHVSLLDTNLALLDTVDLTFTVATGEGNIILWSSPTATIPITNIQLIHGEAVFYISSEDSLNTIMTLNVPNSTQFNYVSGKANLVVEKLPPWPIIDFAKMLDTDCDNIPDALHIVVTNEYQPGQKFSAVSFVYGKDTLKTTNLLSQNGKELLVGIKVPAEVKTDPSGYITLVTNDNGVSRIEPDFYQDGIGPTLLSISVLERLDTAKNDKVYLQFSEPISAPEAAWPTKLFGADKSSPRPMPKVNFTKIYNDSLNIWEFEVAFDEAGNSLITEGMFAQLLSASGIEDKNGNKVSTLCGQSIIPVTLKMQPIPFVYAAIFDKDQDGTAEYVHMEFERPMDQRHIPDSISIIFGTTRPETLWVKNILPLISEDGIYASIDLKATLGQKPFSYGITSGTYEGSSRGRAISGAGLVVQHMGTDASYETNSVLAEDKVGPVFIDAFMESTKSGNIDMLRIEISEPTNVRDTAQIYYLQKKEDKELSIYKNSLISLSMTTNNSVISSSYNSEGNLTVTDGDFVRMEPVNIDKAMLGALIDKNGNSPSLNNPWIPISSRGDTKVKFNIYMRDEISLSSKTDLSPVMSIETFRLYALNTKTNSLDYIQNGMASPLGMTAEVLKGAVWVMELTVPRGASISEPVAWDTLKLQYNIPIYSNLGNYVNRLAGTFNILPDQYLSNAGKVTLYAEMPNMPGTGIQAENGRAVGTGAYISKAQFTAKFIPNKTKDTETQERFSSETNYDQTKTFGIKRLK